MHETYNQLFEEAPRLTREAANSLLEEEHQLVQIGVPSIIELDVQPDPQPSFRELEYDPDGTVGKHPLTWAGAAKRPAPEINLREESEQEQRSQERRVAGLRELAALQKECGEFYR